MSISSFISDGKSSYSDPSRLLFHFFRQDVAKVLKKRSSGIALIVIGVIAAAAGGVIAVNETAGVALLGAGVVLLIIGIVILAQAKVDKEVTKLGLAYLPVNQLNFQNGSIQVDRSGVMGDVNFDFTNLNADNIQQAHNEFVKLDKHLDKIPLVLTGGTTMALENHNDSFHKENLKIYKEEKEYHDMNLNLEDIFSRTENYHVKIPAYANDPKFTSELDRVQNGKPNHIIEKIKTNDIKAELNKIDGIVQLYEDKKEQSIDIDDLCLQILDVLARSMPRLDYTTNVSLNELTVGGTYKFTRIIDMASYNYYCPECNKQAIEYIEHGDYTHSGDRDNRVEFPRNTLMEPVDINSNRWLCKLCNKETNVPYPKHKMDDELFTPVYDKLYEEHFKDRLSIYNHINDEKRKYGEKAEVQFHQVKRESRDKQDALKSKIRTIQSDIMADDAAIEELNGLLLKYKRIAEQKSKEIKQDLANSKEKIAKENAKSRKRIDSAVAQANKNIDASTKRYSTLEREDQSKRDNVQKQIAENTRATAENTEKIAANTAQIANNTRRSAEALEDANRWRLGKKMKNRY